MERKQKQPSTKSTGQQKSTSSKTERTEHTRDREWDIASQSDEVLDAGSDLELEQRKRDQDKTWNPRTLR